MDAAMASIELGGFRVPSLASHSIFPICPACLHSLTLLVAPTHVLLELQTCTIMLVKSHGACCQGRWLSIVLSCVPLQSPHLWPFFGQMKGLSMIAVMLFVLTGLWEVMQGYMSHCSLLEAVAARLSGPTLPLISFCLFSKRQDSVASRSTLASEADALQHIHCRLLK